MRLFRADGHADGRAHAQRRIHAFDGRQGAQGVAADIAKHRQPQLFDGKEGCSVRAARAQHRRARGQRGLLRRFIRAKGLTDALHAQLSLTARVAFARYGNAHGGDLLLKDALQLLDHHQLVHPGGKITHGGAIHGIAQSQLQNAGFWQRLAYILIHHTRAHHAQRRAAHFHAVEAQACGLVLHALLAHFHHQMTLAGHAGHHHIFHKVFFVFAHRQLCAFAHFHRGALMRQARGQAQKNGRIVALAQFKSALNIIMAFLAVGRLQHGDVRRAGDHAAVLFILAGMHIGIVRRHDHQPRVHARIGSGIQGIGRHIDAHMLHAAHGARARHGRAEGRFHSHLFVGGPFAVDFGISSAELRNLRAWRARIAGYHPHAGLIRAARNGLVAQHQLFHR